MSEGGAMPDEEYDEVDARVRIPRGQRLADSKATEGWSRGFTPKSADRGPSHVEIRVKGQHEGAGEPESQVVFVTQYVDSDERTRDQEEVDDLLRALVVIGIYKAAERAAPHVKRWWNSKAVPFLAARLDALRGSRRAKARAGIRMEVEPAAIADSGHVEPTQDELAMLATYEASMSSDEARQRFVAALVAKRFHDEQMRILATVPIDDASPHAELARTVKALDPSEVELILNRALTENPHLLDDVDQLLKPKRSEDALQLDHKELRETLRLSDDD